MTLPEGLIHVPVLRSLPAAPESRASVTGKDGTAERKVTPRRRHFPGRCLVLS
jgi:hypothetical protein